MKVDRILSRLAVVAALTLFWSATASANGIGSVVGCGCQGGGHLAQTRVQR